MLSLESQLQNLADVAEAATEPIDLPTQSEQVTHTSHRYVLAAAAALVIGIGAALLFTAPDTRTEASDEQEPLNDQAGATVVIDDPLNIDLSEVAAQSEGRRLAAIGEVLTFDFEALPTKWDVKRLFAGTTQGRDGPEYWQMTRVTLPGGLHFIVNVEGNLDGSPQVLGERDYGEFTTFRDQPAWKARGEIEWIEQEVAKVQVTGPESRLLGDSLETLVSELQPVRQQLQWFQEPPYGRTVDTDVESILAGALGAVDWTVIPATNERDSLILIVDGFEYGRPARTESDDPNTASIGIETAPGGMIIFGDLPEQISEVALLTETAVVSLPGATQSSGRTAFAVPIEDVIDPLRIEFFDADGGQVGTIRLEDFPPYLNGSIGAGLWLDLD